MKNSLNWLRFRRGPEPAAADIEYRCGEVDLTLPADHGLPLYQQKFSRYDRFLPHIAQFVPSGMTVVDVGANCGDTVAAMAQAGASLHYLCVEPDDVFLAYFHRNLERVQAKVPGASIEVVQAIVGKAVLAASLSGERGTKHMQPDAGGRRTALLDDIYAASPRPAAGLLKSDVDGYDFDVLDSASKLIEDQQPALFFECQYADTGQLNGFRATIDRLFAAGYQHWTVFDNFGEVMMKRATRDAIDQLMEYVWRQNQGGAARTIYYFDLLACTPRHADWVERAVDSY